MTHPGLPALRGNCFRQGINFEKCGAKNLGESEIELEVGKMGAKPEQEQDNTCDLSERVVRAFNKSVY